MFNCFKRGKFSLLIGYKHVYTLGKTRVASWAVFSCNAKRANNYFKLCFDEASFLCLSIVQKKWSLVRVEVLDKNQQSHTSGQNHRSHSKNCSLDWFHWFVNQSSHCWLWENFEVTLVFLSCHHHHQHNKFWTTRIDWHMLPAESYFACFIMQEIITKSSTLSITFFCLRKSIGDLNSCSPNFCQYWGMSIGL